MFNQLCKQHLKSYNIEPYNFTHNKYVLSFHGSCVVCAPLEWYVGWNLDRYIGRYVGWHIDRCSTDMSVQCIPIPISTDMSVVIAADTRPIRWPLIIGGISVECRWLSSKATKWNNANTKKKRRKKGKVRPS